MSGLRRVQPHEYFRVDFDTMLEEGRQQESFADHNQGEYKIILRMHTYLAEEVLPAILDNDWIFEAAQEFAAKYAEECFSTWKLTGDEVYAAQQNLERLKSMVEDFVVRAGKFDAVRMGQLELLDEKASNFQRVIKSYNLPHEMRLEGEKLSNEVAEHESLQIRVAIRAIRENYAKILPRIMLVIRRAIALTLPDVDYQKYEGLKDISEILDWYEGVVDTSHPLYPVIGELRAFYRVIRNVANHPEDHSWDSDGNTITFPAANDESLEVDSFELMQKHRYLVYLCELGMRGISSAFCEREQGPISNNLLRQYAKIFPEDFPGGEEVIVTFY